MYWFTWTTAIFEVVKGLHDLRVSNGTNSLLILITYWLIHLISKTGTGMKYKLSVEATGLCYYCLVYNSLEKY